MARLNVEIIHPKNELVNQIFAEMDRKYSGQKITPAAIDDIEREAARLREQFTCQRNARRSQHR